MCTSMQGIYSILWSTILRDAIFCHHGRLIVHVMKNNGLTSVGKQSSLTLKSSYFKSREVQDDPALEHR